MKILAAMSGGVDSSVAAALLARQGHEVVGVMMRLFDERHYGVEPPSRTCCAISDIEDARAAAHRIGIPFHVLNLSGPFEKQVMRRFAQEYAAGRTPNPCLDCNRYIKFEELLRRALTMEFEGIATGHYARVEKSEGRWLLRKARDAAKDQSYVLYTLTQEQLSRLLLPLGGMEKADTRDLASDARLPNAEKPDSQDICFVPDGDYAAFLSREYGIALPPGDFVDEDGNRLGQHKGLHHYTVGQRRGLGISGGERLYVLRLDAQNNRVVLGSEGQLHTDHFMVRDLNWISVPSLTGPREVNVRTRYHQQEAPALLYPQKDGSVLVEYETSRRAPAPGQAAVFYEGDVVVGGGVIG